MIDQFRGRLVLSVPEAGRLLYGLGRDAAYAAAERGEIPCHRVGRTLRVPVPAALRDLGWSDDLIARALGLDDPRDTEADSSPESATATVHALARKQEPAHGDTPPAA